jgi:hypothetical protein
MNRRLPLTLRRTRYRVSLGPSTAVEAGHELRHPLQVRKEPDIEEA